MSEEATVEKVGLYNLTKPAILMFSENLFEARKFKDKNGKEQGEAKFGCRLVFDDPANNVDLQAMKKKALAVARAKHPDIDPKEVAFPFQSGDKLADKAKAKGKNGENLRGKVAITSRSKFPIALSVFEGSQIIDLEDEALKTRFKNKFYSGAKVYAELNFVWYDPVKEGDKPGVTAYLNIVLSTGTGERIGGRRGSDVFKAYAGQVSGEDPTTGMEDDADDDGIPF